MKIVFALFAGKILLFSGHGGKWLAIISVIDFKLSYLGKIRYSTIRDSLTSILQFIRVHEATASVGFFCLQSTHLRKNNLAPEKE